jgi:hypothetical protein
MGFNAAGDVLIAGNGSNVPGPHSIVGVNDAQQVGTLTLMAGTGTPAGADPSCTATAGCPDNRVMLADRDGRIVWQYGQAGVTGSGFNALNTPVQATYLPDGHVLITDQANARVIEVTRSHHIVWQYGGPNDPKTLNGTAFASRLPDGDTLITDSNNNRVLIVTPARRVVFSYASNMRPGSIDMPLPTRAVMLRNGHILISDQFNDQVIEISQHKQIVFSQGTIQVDGAGFNQLNAPYDAKVIGDYTGLTPPFGFGH